MVTPELAGPPQPPPRAPEKANSSPWVPFFPYRRRLLATPRGEISVEGPLSPERLAALRMDPGLKSFRSPERQKEALKEIASLPRGAVVAALAQESIVGYVTFHPPDEFERWAHGGLQHLLELGAIEISPSWRRLGIASALLEVSFADGALDDYIVISPEYYWHWDLEGTGLSIWQYRKVLESVMGRVGLEPRPTDDPEISSHPANMLMVRVGPRVPREDVIRFEQLRYPERPIL